MGKPLGSAMDERNAPVNEVQLADWPPALIQEIAERRCVIVIGAGLSAQSRSAIDGTRPPSWSGLVEALAKSCFRREIPDVVERRIQAGSLLEAINEIRKHADPQSFDRAMTQILVEPRFQASESHDHVIELDQQVVISLNFDSIYEDQCRKGDSFLYRVTGPTHGDLGRHIRGPSKVIYKLHGSIANPDTIVFGTQDYIRNAQMGSGDLRVIEALLLTRTVLFIGCGFNGDPDVDLLLESMSKAGSSNYPHYALVRKSEGGGARGSSSSNAVQRIEYGGTPEDPHAYFAGSLKELAHEVRERRRTMG